jgi:hypothetical protein
MGGAVVEVRVALAQELLAFFRPAGFRDVMEDGVHLIAEAGIVDEHDQDVRRPLRRRHLRRLVPVGLRALESLLRDSVERWAPNRQRAAVDRRSLILWTYCSEWAIAQGDARLSLVQKG